MKLDLKLSSMLKLIVIEIKSTLTKTTPQDLPLKKAHEDGISGLFESKEYLE